jgi:hydrogenase maturation protease
MSAPRGRERSDEQGLELWEVSFEGKVVVVGLGNPFMRDDGIGIQVARRLRGIDPNRFFVYETQAMDLSLLWQFRNASRIILVDAMRSGGAAGEVSKFEVAPKEAPLTKMPNMHALQLYDIFDIVHQPGILPCPLTIVGVEPKDCSPGEGLTEEVAAAIPAAVDAVLGELGYPGLHGGDKK